ncbi:MAG: branched-chain amino acid aminotransferase [Nitrospira bacterium HGW-Nitrospira-1]|nr:MAG: branched-chain amino acid aminotransferase [Nitrospira bacterium HGW-Nitrospira-1]
MEKDMRIFLNKKIVPEPEAVVSVYDHGFLYGDGIYETMRAYNGVVFMLDKHLERLGRSASLTKLDIPETGFIKDAVSMTMEANKLSDAYIRVTVSRGKGAIGLDPALCKEPTFVVIAEHFKKYPEHLYSSGVKLVIAKTRRNLVFAINPKIKSLNFLNNIFAKMEAKERGAYEAIMLNAEGLIAEGTVSNIFFVKDNVLCTPAPEVGALDGITREVVINLAKKNGVKVSEGEYYPDDLFNASEVFFTNTTSEIMPVSQVELIDYKVGDVTKSLHMLYKEEVSAYIKNYRGN